MTEIEKRAHGWRADQQRKGRIPCTSADLARAHDEALAEERGREREAARIRREAFGFNPPKRWTERQKARARGEDPDAR